MSPVQLTSDGIDPSGYQMAKFALRVDAPLQLQVGDHVRLRPNNAPQNDPQHPRTAIDAMVTRSYQDVWFLRCLHRLPTYAEVCSWELVSSESFVTAKTMFDAILMLHSQKSACCKLYPTLIGCSDTHVEFQTKAHSFLSRAMLNDSQKKAVEVAVSHSCSFIWAPKGTGSMNTTLAIVDQLQIGFPHTRILVAASSHQAVDNILRRYIAHRQATGSGTAPLRVSTRVCCWLHILRRQTS
jgi:regulator of nonsense transcripts 1